MMKETETRTRTDAVREHIAAGLTAAESAVKVVEEFGGTEDSAKGVYYVTRSGDLKKKKKTQKTLVVKVPVPAQTKTEYVRANPDVYAGDLAVDMAKRYGGAVAAARSMIHTIRRRDRLASQDQAQVKSPGMEAEPEVELLGCCPRCGLSLKAFYAAMRVSAKLGRMN